jgi:YfiH family protein
MTLRHGGVSEAPWSSWNLGDHVGDDPSHVEQNRHLLAERLGVCPVFLRQVHGIEVLQLSTQSQEFGPADGCVTDQAGLACTMMVADCLPVLLTSRDGRTVGAAHAGWRGLAAGVLERTVAALRTLHGGAASDEVLAWLGPCIGPTVFEVGDEVRQAFIQQEGVAATCFVARNGKWLADLPALAQLALRRAGVPKPQIFGNDGTLEWCTVSHPERYFSHRRDTAQGASTGRMAGCIWRSEPRP